SAGFALETVSQVQIITNQFSAEFGGHSAGVMNMITKSGSNKYAGAALLVVRPGDLDAIPPLATQKVPLNQQQFGGNVGGPIARDRAFFFGSYERRRERRHVSATRRDAPGRHTPSLGRTSVTACSSTAPATRSRAASRLARGASSRKIRGTCPTRCRSGAATIPSRWAAARPTT